MSIYRDKRTGRWCYDFDRYVDGRRTRKRRLLPAGWTRAQADAYDRKESGALSAIAEGIARPRFPIDEAVRRYLKEHAPGLKHAANLKRELSATFDWWTGRAIEELPAVCAEYAHDQRQALKPATIKNRIAYLRAACRWAWRRHGMAESDPGARVETPAVHNARDVSIDRAQMLALARACEDMGTRALIRIAFYSGLRVSEQYAAERRPGLFVLRDTKNGAPRVVPIHPKIASAARVPLTPRTQIDWWWRKARAAAGLEHVTLHDLRHAAASAMVNAGIDLATVGAVLGHKSHASTMRYSHWATDRLTEAVGKIGRKRA
jgi:integrase